MFKERLLWELNPEEVPSYVTFADPVDLAPEIPMQTSLDQAKAAQARLLDEAERYPELYGQGMALPAIRIFERHIQERMGVSPTQLYQSRFQLLQQIRKRVAKGLERH